MTLRFGRVVASVVSAVAVLAVAACGSSTSSQTSSASHPLTSVPASSSSTSTSASAPSSPTRATAAQRYSTPAHCLMTAADVASVLGGSWTMTGKGSGNCAYHSDRGAIFAIEPIPTPPAEQRAALADARVHNCATPPRDVPRTGGAFVCIERPNSGDVIEGNIIAQGYFWVIVMVGAGADPNYPAQTDAMAALLRAVRI
jgi:hypothetical protein